MFSRYFGVTIPIKGQSEECESTQRSLNQQVMTAILEKKPEQSTLKGEIITHFVIQIC